MNKVLLVFACAFAIGCSETTYVNQQPDLFRTWKCMSAAHTGMYLFIELDGMKYNTPGNFFEQICQDPVNPNDNNCFRLEVVNVTISPNGTLVVDSPGGSGPMSVNYVLASDSLVLTVPIDISTGSPGSTTLNCW